MMKNSFQKWGALTSTLLFLITFACASAKKSTDPTLTDHGDTNPAFRELMDEYTLSSYKLDPFWDFYTYKEHPGPDMGDDLSDANVGKRIQLTRDTLKKYAELKPLLTSKLDLESAVLFEDSLHLQIRYDENPWTRLVDTNHLSNRIYTYGQMGAGLASFPFESKADFENYIARAQGLKAWSASLQKRLAQAKSQHFKLSRTSVELLIKSWERLLTANPEDSQFFQPVLTAEKQLAQGDVAALRARYLNAIQTEIFPAIRTNIRALKAFAPFAGKQFGIFKVTGDDSLYDLYRTTCTDASPLSAQQIHTLGLKEVKRIRSEIEKIKITMGYEKLSFEAFLKQVREDPNSTYKTSGELTAAFRDAESRVMKVVDRYFSNNPNIPLQIRGIPDPKSPAGSYSPMSDTVKKAYFNFNSADLTSTTRYGTHTLFLHEGVPGHHFQLSINYFLKPKLGKFRTELFFSVPFVEGWALYAEYLGKEMGIYDTPELLLGTYNDEMMRAVRLVVDTGIHSLGWSRAEAVKYMHSQLAEELEGVETEIDRYAVWPGQALGYKLGQLEILRLRHDAEKKLGSRFDLKTFHRVVLESGNITLTLLQRNVAAWLIASK